MFTKVNKTLEYFFLFPTSRTHLREIARRSKSSPAGSLKTIRKLLKKSIIKKDKENGRILYHANTENSEFAAMKKAYNILMIYVSGLVHYLQEKYEHPKAIVLFGSYARGEDTEKSDIDIAVLHQGVNIELGEFEKKLGRKINIVEIADLKNAKKGFINSLVNGIVLEGYLEVIDDTSI